MPIESASKIEDLNVLNPLVNDPRSEGDDHLRLIKSVLHTLLPAVPGASGPKVSQISSGTATVTSAALMLSSETPSTADVLDNLSLTGVNDGAVVTLRANSPAAEPITVSTVGNLELQGSGVVLLDTAFKWITFQRLGATWFEVGRFPRLLTIEEYDLMHPIRSCLFFSTSHDPNDDVPDHLISQVTWSLLGVNDRYLRINSNAGDVFDTGGNASVPVPQHHHTNGSLEITLNAESTGAAGGGFTRAEVKTYNVEGETGNIVGTVPQIPITPKFRDFRVWQRTA
jgi:hypothetical protein